MTNLEHIHQLVAAEKERQMSTLSLIPSENYVSKAVLEVSGSVLTNKYAEGYPGRRYYAGNGVVDDVERYACELAQQLFETDYHVNVQPYSGSPANLAVYAALLEPGDTILAMALGHGGHLTHGHPVSFTGKLYNFVHYGVSRETELIDYDEVEAQAKEHKPKLIICGATAYPAFIDFVRFEKIAKEVGALLMVDMAHFAGLIAGKQYQTPFGHADIITSTTHKTLRGPRGGIIFCKEEFAKAIDKAVFPGLQGGPHMQTIAAKAVAFAEALEPSFALYAKQIVANAKAMVYRLQQHGLRLVSDGTDTHLFLLDLQSTGMAGKEAADLLEEYGIVCNMNSIPFDQRPPLNPSGLRFGTPAITTRGMKEKDVELVADCIAAVLHKTEVEPSVKATITQLTKKFRIPGY